MISAHRRGYFQRPITCSLVRKLPFCLTAALHIWVNFGQEVLEREGRAKA